MITSIEQAAEFFYAPVRWGLSPDAEAADTHTLAWVQETGLVRSNENAQVFATWHIGSSVAAGYPRARGEALNLLSDWAAWALTLDDIFNRYTGDVAFVATILDDCLRVLHSDPAGSVPHPLRGANRALWDLLSRAAAVMSDEWMFRFRSSVGRYFQGLLGKHRLARIPRQVDPVTALAVRTDDIGMHMSADLIEYFEGFELPMVVTTLYGFSRIRTLLSELVVLQNDVFSLQRDRLAGDSDSAFNVVTALAHHHNQGTEHALLETRALYRTRLTALESASGQFLDECHTIGLDSNSCGKAELYTVNLRDLVTGTFHAHLQVAARGYLDHPPTVPTVSELLPDYQGCELRPVRTP
ncbi:hypothetical protein [Kitasatospora sp. NPDC089509]|uniref:terpene synthase family protein n=1 Tax=Kitasatospora sp. NPDC089509 TaxID=3364079 RepID=UPI00382A0577